jgi:hypothetical protein
MLPPPAITTRRIAVGAQAAARAVDGDHARVGVRQVLAHVAQLLTHQQAALHRAQADEPHAAAGEVDDLQGAGIADQPPDVSGHELLGTHVHVDGEAGARRGHAVLRRHEELGAGGEVRRAYPRDAGRRAEQRPRDVAGHHVDLVAVGQRHQHVGAGGASLLERARARRIAAHRANVEPVLQVAQQLVIDVDDRDVVGFLAGEMVGRGPAHLAGAEDDYFHGREL